MDQQYTKIQFLLILPLLQGIETNLISTSIQLKEELNVTYHASLSIRNLYLRHTWPCVKPTLKQLFQQSRLIPPTVHAQNILADIKFCGHCQCFFMF